MSKFCVSAKVLAMAIGSANVTSTDLASLHSELSCNAPVPVLINTVDLAINAKGAQPTVANFAADLTCAVRSPQRFPNQWSLVVRISRTYLNPKLTFIQMITTVLSAGYQGSRI